MRFEASWQELQAIPGATILKSPDSLKLEVTVRNGTVIEIHPDHVKRWPNTAFAKQFEQLSNEHSQNFKELLQPILTTAGEGGTSSKTDALVSAENKAGKDDSGTDAAKTVTLKTWDSFEKLHAEDEIAHRVASEIAGVELLKGKSGRFYVISEKGKVVAKHTLLGGFGTGKCLISNSSSSGVLVRAIGLHPDMWMRSSV